MPALVLVALALAWMLSLGVSQGTLAHAAREGARSAARGDSAPVVRAAVRRVAPGAVVTIARGGSLVEVSASLQRRPPGRLLRPMGRTLRASATGWQEVP